MTGSSGRACRWRIHHTGRDRNKERIADGSCKTIKLRHAVSGTFGGFSRGGASALRFVFDRGTLVIVLALFLHDVQKLVRGSRQGIIVRIGSEVNDTSDTG